MTEKARFASAAEIASSVRQGTLTALSVTDSALDCIGKTDDQFQAFRHVDADGARVAAQAIDAKLRSGDRLGPLAGVPIGVKENLSVKGLPCEMGSVVRRGEFAEEDAPVIRRLRMADAVIVGMTRMPEFGHLGLGHSPLGEATRNPWSLAHTPGGSSSGSAAAVAAGQVALALGTDGGGSIRIPAACCGVVGHKPTLGRVPHPLPRAGFTSLSHLGPIARSVVDVALMMDVITDQDPVDPPSLPKEKLSYTSIAACPPSSGRIAWVPHLGDESADEDVVQLCQQVIDALIVDGYEVTILDPFLDDWIDEWAVLFDVMLAAIVHGRVDDVRRLSEATLIARVDHGLATTAIDYVLADAARREVWAVFEKLYRKFDVVMTPSLLHPPLPVDPDTGITNEPEIWADRWFRHMYPFNLTGQPAISVPVGLNPIGLPVGLQVVGPRLADGLTIGFAAAVERRSSWVGWNPDLHEDTQN